MHARRLEQLDGADLLGVLHVRAAAEVGEAAVAVEGDLLALGDVGQALELELGAQLAENLGGFLAAHLDALEGGVFADDLPHLLFDLGQVVAGERLGAAEVVLELLRMVDAAGVDLGARPQALHRVGQHVLGAVADEGAGFAVFAREEPELAAARQGRAQVDRLAVELGADRRFGEAGADRARHVERSRARANAAGGSVGQN